MLPTQKRQLGTEPRTTAWKAVMIPVSPLAQAGAEDDKPHLLAPLWRYNPQWGGLSQAWVQGPPIASRIGLEPTTSTVTG